MRKYILTYVLYNYIIRLQVIWSRERRRFQAHIEHMTDFKRNKNEGKYGSTGTSVKKRI